MKKRSKFFSVMKMNLEKLVKILGEIYSEKENVKVKFTLIERSDANVSDKILRSSARSIEKCAESK